MFTYIVNPITNKKVLSNSKIGKKIIENYRTILDEVQSGGDIHVAPTGEITNKLPAQDLGIKYFPKLYSAHVYIFKQLINFETKSSHEVGSIDAPTALGI